MNKLIKNFLAEEDGQDLIEYALLLGFVCIASAALLTNISGSLQSLWTSTNGVLSNAATPAAS